MTTLLTSVAQVAHSIASSLLKQAQIKAGSTIPQELVKENIADESLHLPLVGKNIILGIPAAFGGSNIGFVVIRGIDPSLLPGVCNRQVPEYMEAYQHFKAKGVNEIFVVTVNDVFVTKAWKEQLAPEGTDIRFIADDKGGFTSRIGLIFDATNLLGGPRSERYAIIAEGDKVVSIAVEKDFKAVTITSADNILAQLI